jgi:hypothetical protein
MILEAALVLCLTNATDAAVFGQVRDGRFKTTSAKLSGTSLTYREPVAQAPFPSVAAGQTGCAPIDAQVMAQPLLALWSRQPISDAPAGTKADLTCRPSAAAQPGQRLTFVYRKSLTGRLTCKETR